MISVLQELLKESGTGLEGSTTVLSQLSSFGESNPRRLKGGWPPGGQ
jgi:hypothetical protein